MHLLLTLTVWWHMVMNRASLFDNSAYEFYSTIKVLVLTSEFHLLWLAKSTRKSFNNVWCITAPLVIMTKCDAIEKWSSLFRVNNWWLSPSHLSYLTAIPKFLFPFIFTFLFQHHHFSFENIVTLESLAPCDKYTGHIIHDTFIPKYLIQLA